MAASRDIIEKVQNIVSYQSGDAKTQIMSMAIAIVELDKHQRQMEEKISACAEAIQDLLVVVKAIKNRG